MWRELGTLFWSAVGASLGVWFGVSIAEWLYKHLKQIVFDTLQRKW